LADNIGDEIRNREQLEEKKGRYEEEVKELRKAKLLIDREVQDLRIQVQNFGARQTLVRKLEEEVARLRTAFSEEAAYRNDLELDNKSLVAELTLMKKRIITEFVPRNLFMQEHRL
jgi:predicted RNase H-like nuclease (RuvC/YqgF family)